MTTDRSPSELDDSVYPEVTVKPFKLSEQLDLKSNYNVCLFHFIDSLSVWDPNHLRGHILNHFKQNYDLYEEDENKLDQYRKDRRELNWEEETSLFQWAYKGFPDNPKYKQLLEVIQFFECKENHQGVSLKVEIEEGAQKAQELITKSKEALDQIDIQTVLFKAESLFKREGEHKKRLDCFLPFSPTRGSQGGANGKGIYREIPLKDDFNINLSNQIITHEFMHLVLEPRIFLTQDLGEEAKCFYKQLLPSIYPEDLSGFFNEVIVYSLTDVAVFNEDPYKNILWYEENGDTRAVNIWKAVLYLQPVFGNFLEGRVNIDETRIKFYQGSRSFIEKMLNGGGGDGV